MEHLVSQGALSAPGDARFLADAVVAERFGGGGAAGAPVDRDRLRAALSGAVADLRGRSGWGRRLRAALLPTSALPGGPVGSRGGRSRRWHLPHRSERSSGVKERPDT